MNMTDGRTTTEGRTRSQRRVSTSEGAGRDTYSGVLVNGGQESRDGNSNADFLELKQEFRMFRVLVEDLIQRGTLGGSKVPEAPRHMCQFS